MAVCDYCKQDMLKADGCISIPVKVGGDNMSSIPYGEEQRYSGLGDGPERCHDCNAKRGKLHHPGCDVEECPKCHRQLISCGCLEG